MDSPLRACLRAFDTVHRLPKAYELQCAILYTIPRYNQL